MSHIAKITKKSQLDASGRMSYTFNVVVDGAEIAKDITVNGVPSEIQQIVSKKVLFIAQENDLYNSLPNAGDELVCDADPSFEKDGKIIDVEVSE